MAPLSLVGESGDKSCSTTARRWSRWTRPLASSSGATTEASRRSLFEFNYGPRIVVQEKVILYAGGDGKKMGLDAASGEVLWSSDDPRRATARRRTCWYPAGCCGRRR